MDKDRRESRGQGTLLLVIKQDPKACVSYLKEFIEFAIGRQTTSSPSALSWMGILCTLSLIFGIDSHPLVELVYVLYGVRSTVVHSESRLMESPKEFYPFYFACEG